MSPCFADNTKIKREALTQLIGIHAIHSRYIVHFKCPSDITLLSNDLDDVRLHNEAQGRGEVELRG